MSNNMEDYSEISEMEKREKYYVVADDVLVSSQLVLFKSILGFYIQMNENIDILESIIDGDGSDEEIELPHPRFEEILKKHFENDSENSELDKIMSSVEDIIDRVANDLNLSEPESTTEKILTRDKRIILEKEEIKNIHPDIPINHQSVQSSLSSGLITLVENFKDTHKLVINDDFTEQILNETVYPNSDRTITENYPLETLRKNELKSDILDLDDYYKPFVLTTEPELIKEIIDELDDGFNIFGVFPRNFGFIEIDEIDLINKTVSDVW